MSRTFVMCVVVVVLLFSDVMVWALMRTPGPESPLASVCTQTQTCYHHVFEYSCVFCEIVCVCVTSEDSYVMVFVSVWTTGMAFTCSSWAASSICNHINIISNQIIWWVSSETHDAREQKLNDDETQNELRMWREGSGSTSDTVVCLVTVCLLWWCRRQTRRRESVLSWSQKTAINTSKKNKIHTTKKSFHKTQSSCWRVQVCVHTCVGEVQI